jgi:elongation factor Ts
MAEFTAKDVAALRKATGVGMMDCKKALTETDGDMEKAAQWLREKGLAKAANLADRENAQGAVAVATDGKAAAAVQLKSETDFSAKSEDFVAVVQKLADAVLADGEGAIAALTDAVDDLKVTKKENIEVGRVARIEVAEGNVLDAYLHVQDGRGVNAVLVELAGATPEQAHEVAVHAAFAKPAYLSRDEAAEDEVAKARESFEGVTRAEGKPEQAIAKIVDGRMNKWFSERVLPEQPFVKDDKQTVAQWLGDATIVRFAQIVIGV